MSKPSKIISDLLADRIRESGAEVIFVEGESDNQLLMGHIEQYRTEGGSQRIVVTTSPNLNAELRRVVLEKELRQILFVTDPDLVTTSNFDRLLSDLVLPKKKKVELTVKGVVIPERKVHEGVLVKATSVVWVNIIEELEKKDWIDAHQIPSRVWEEIVAGAFVKSGFDEVILTPRSNDHGRDVIAVRNGVGSIRILDSVKAYRPGHLVTKEEVHALMGVLAIDPNASKGILTTTSDFAPRLLEDPRLALTIPHRIELMNGTALRAWLKSLIYK